MLQPLKSDFVISKESLAKKIKDKSSAFLTGVFFKGAENSGGNALGGLDFVYHRFFVKKFIKPLN